MSEETKKLFEERLGRYQAAIALEPHDRIPIATGSNYFAEVYSGNTKQETIYDPDKWLQAEIKFCQDFPEVDVLRNNRVYGPLYDALNVKTYKLPGRDLPANTQFQFMEQDYMKEDEYDDLINDPPGFMIDILLPRILGELGNRGTGRSYIAMLKAGMAQAMFGGIMRNRGIVLEQQCGMPQPMAGFFLAPFDALADAMRGMTATFLDMFRQPDKVLAACDVLVQEMAHMALSVADPLKRYPIFVPLHKAIFMSPEQFDMFYWPSFKKVMEIIIDSGYNVRAYLEGDWGKHWHHMRELPKGRVLCDIDSQGDIHQAKKDLGGFQCIAGGVQDSMLILGTTDQVREHVRELCQTVGKGGGYIVSAGCSFPYDAKPENFRAMIDAVMEYGWHDKSIKAKPKAAPPVRTPEGLNPRRVMTPWDVKKTELGQIMGDENLIKKNWEQLETMAHTFMWQWTL
ncbi:MAG: uroporphyrinogen decarboxylase [Desulfomonile tiedjei]|uniref:Uroporphyrinogen decarboxylase n=1 Tax=Desulfomonile tiedjei TaxID=2358 RepID=A0A9D6UZZ4_9BACT|nr:uroporphyrinogen decarboxylase [Desulfomonile tiedjei]